MHSFYFYQGAQTMPLLTYPLTKEDCALIQQGYEALQKNHIADKRFVATAFRTTSGDIITALNIRAYLGRASVCAEPIALSHVISNPALKPITLVTICYPGFITTPCGICRELLIDYYPDLMVIVPDKDEIKKCCIQDMMPMKFYGTSKNCFNNPNTIERKHAQNL